MKKLLAIVLLVAMCISMISCNKTDSQTEDTTASLSEETTKVITNETTSKEQIETTEAIVDETTTEAQVETTEAVGDETTTEEQAETTQVTAEETTTEAPTETTAEPEPPAPPTVTLYQLAPEQNSLMQSYVIKTKGGKLIVIDGGIDGEGKDRSPYMPAALRAIAGVGQGEYFEVEAWFLSHAHKDHMYELSKMLSEYSEESNYKINNIYFDFPEFGKRGEYSTKNEDMEISKIRENMNKYGEVIGAGENYYDQINGAFINAEAIAQGLYFEIDGVRFDILQTWSNADGSNINDTSIVIRMTAEGQSVLFLNDLATMGGRRLLATYGDQLKSDIVQMAHHGQGGVSKDVYEAIDAQVHLWPTPVWVWRNDGQIYQIDEVRKWLYGESFLEADAYNIVAGLYEKYPTNSTSVESWKSVLDGMKIELPYILPERPDPTHPEDITPPEPITPVEHDYVSDGLVAYYSGTQSTRDGHNMDSDVWEDLVCGNDMNITKNSSNYFTEQGLRASNAKHNFPDAIVDTINGKAFTIEILLGDFVSVGTNYNTFISSIDDNFALFRRNSENVIELKTLGNGRIKIPGALDKLQNSLITIVYAQADVCCIYINGALAGQIATSNGSLAVSNFFIGHTDASKTFDTTYRSIRFYDRALTAEEAMANAVVDGVAAQ